MSFGADNFELLNLLKEMRDEVSSTSEKREYEETIYELEKRMGLRND